MIIYTKKHKKNDEEEFKKLKEELKEEEEKFKKLKKRLEEEKKRLEEEWKKNFFLIINSTDYTVEFFLTKKKTAIRLS